MPARAQAVSTIVDANGRPMRRADTAFAAASTRSQELALYNPRNFSADSALLPERDRMAARVHDMARNDGWASAGLQKHLDNAIGARFTLSMRPDWRALGLSREWAREWSRQVESEWRSYAEDPDFYCDAARQGSMVSRFALMYRHRAMDGEAIGQIGWMPGRGGRYSTTLQVVDPDRLSNPFGRGDSEFLRGGVELGPSGEPLAYHFRRGHPGDMFGFESGLRQIEWDTVPRETAFGRRIVIHDFEADRAGQTRGRSPLAPILQKLRMLAQYDQAELQAAVFNAIFAAFIESPMDSEMVGQALGTAELTQYQEQRLDFAEKTGLKMNGLRVPHLFPGEKLGMQQPVRPSVAFAAFEAACLRNVASALGLSYEQLSMDWSQVNYSSARAALLEVWKFFTARRTTFAEQTARQVVAAWLEEAIDIGTVELPPGAPEFRDAKPAYTRCKWIGPGRGWVDPLKEAQAALMRMMTGISTLRDEAAEQGYDWEDQVEQRAVEVKTFTEQGLELPSWAAVSQTVNQGASQPQETNSGGGNAQT